MVEPSESNGSPGKTLKEARERLGLSVPNVARDLHLSNTQINALEADDYQHFHGETYVRGYLRSYARLVGVDPAEILRRSQATVDRPVDVPESGAPSAQPANRRGPWLGVALMLIVGSLGYLVYTSDSDRGSGPAREAVSSAPVSPVYPDGSGRLVFSATAPAWIEVRDARGRRLLYQMVVPDRQTAIEGQPPFHVYIGHVDVVEVQYNGSRYDLTPHVEGMYARFVVK